MQANEKINFIIENIEKVIVGKRASIELVMIALISEGHVLIEDVPGVGKTLLVSALAKSLNAIFRRIQFTPDVLPSDITGFSVYNQKSGEFEFRHGAVMGNIVLADEINRTSPKTQSSLLEAMEEGQVTVDGFTYELPKPFIVLATQNPIEYLGTYPLPEAQIDRFFLKIEIGYPSKAEESAILELYRSNEPINTLQAVASSSDIIALQALSRSIHVDAAINDYIVNIVAATRNNPLITLGASVRGSLSLFRAAQAKAMFCGRSFVIPDDVKEMIFPVLSHRIILSSEAKLSNQTPKSILHEILNRTAVPGVKR